MNNKRSASVGMFYLYTMIIVGLIVFGIEVLG